MATTPGLPTAPPLEGGLDARSYARAYAAKLMVVTHRGDRPSVPADFFHLDNVSTHPTGLVVTGLFDDNRRVHMMASTVRLATDEEIAAREDRRARE